jgi:hypothetical protein
MVLTVTVSLIHFVQSSPITFLVASIADFQQPKYRLQERQGFSGQVDRREGIKAVEIAGEKLSLVAALLNVQDMPSSPPGEIYRLGFFLQQAESNVKLQVRDYNFFKGKGYYWMLPTRTGYADGFQEFAWGAQLAQELGIHLKDLGAVAILGGHGHMVIAPLLLHAAPFPPRIQGEGCRFIFVPNETMVVDYRLFPVKDEHRAVLESTSMKWYKDRTQMIKWDGTNLQGKPADEGRYILKLTSYINVAGKPADRIPYDYEFYYKPEIIYQPPKP